MSSIPCLGDCGCGCMGEDVLTDEEVIITEEKPSLLKPLLFAGLGLALYEFLS